MAETETQQTETKPAAQPNAQSTFWEKTKTWSGAAYTKAKPGFDKVYAVVDKLGAPVNRLSNKVGSEAFWPTTLDKESEKCARILRTFCKDGFYEKIDEHAAKQEEENPRDPKVNNPQGTQRNIVKIPAKVIQNAVGLAIFTTMRTGWLFGGSGGAGVVMARHPETGEWSPPSGIMTQNFSIGFLAGVDIFDTVLVINNYRALEAFTRLRCTLGTEVGVAAGPVGVGGEIDMELHKKPAPVWSYVKSRGLYAGVALSGNAIIERSDENERFYGERIPVADILVGKVRHPPIDEYRILMATIQAAEGKDVDESLLPAGFSPGDMELDAGGSFGIPADDDDDPYGVKALEAEGLHIREAGTHQRPSAEIFEFRPSPSSPVYRGSIDDGSTKRRTGSWRNSMASVATDRGTQTDEEDVKDSRNASPAKKPPLPPRPKSMKSEPEEISQSIDEHNPIHEASVAEKAAEKRHSISDLDSDIDSDAEIGTAVPTATKARVVTVPKSKPPVLPIRNPIRSMQSADTFTIKLKTTQNIPTTGLALRTSIDDWSSDQKGELKNGVWEFKLDSTKFTDDFECKFVILPDRWMQDPNLVVTSPTANDEITFTDDRVTFSRTEDDAANSTDENGLFLNQDDTDIKKAASTIDGEDEFVSVPPTPELEKSKPS